MSSVADVHCGLAWAPYVRRAGSSFMMFLASLSFRVLRTLIIAPLLSRKLSVSCSPETGNDAQCPKLAPEDAAQLRGNVPRTGAYKRNVVLPHLVLIHEALFSAHAHRSIPCLLSVLSAPLVRLCHEVRRHVVSCNVLSARTATLLSSSTFAPLMRATRRVRDDFFLKY